MPTDLPAEIELLRRLVLQQHSIDLIELNLFLNLVYTDDEWYTRYPAHYKNRSAYDLAEHKKPQAPIIADLDALIDEFNVASNPLGFLIAHYCRIYPEFTVCDIGSQYGTSTMTAALFLRSLRANAKVFSFEPGIAGGLTPLNYENNGFPEIKFYNAAVGPVDGYVVLHREIGHSANNRIVNPLRSRERGSVSVPVRCVRMDTVLQANGAFGPTIAKIDTQGGEPGVIRGMSELLRQHPVSMLLEYTPQAIAKVIDPAAFIGSFLETHYCFDTGINGSHLFEVHAAHVGEHRRAVLASPGRWVDLLLIAKTVPNVDAICARIRAVARPARS